jgi:Xaa-Pro aminopeptidase
VDNRHPSEFSVDHFAWRREQLFSALPADIDVMAVSNPLNVTYLSGFTGDSSWLLLSRQHAILVSDGRYEVQIAEECPGLEAVIRPPDQRIDQAVAQVLAKLSPRYVGVEATHLTVNDFNRLKELAPTLNFAETGGQIETLRRIKDESEVAEIRAAVRIAEKAHAMFVALLAEDDTEKELADAMEGYLRRAGGTGSSFAPIVAIGDRSALPHAQPGPRCVAESPFLLLDWGATGRLYKSDITRILLTRHLLGIEGAKAREIESRLENLYTVVLRGQEIALQMMRPGAKACDVDRAVRAHFEKHGVNAQFNHGLGHGIGLQIHEGPMLRSNSDDVLVAGNVVTVEPGVYFPGFGGVRIEDDVLVTPDGCEVLTSLPKDVASVFGR